MSVFPTPHSILHIPRSYNSGDLDSHGNPIREDGDPVIRRVISIARTGVTPTSMNVNSQEFLERDIIDLVMAVPDPEVYHAGDQVVVGGTVDGDDYDGGVAYWIDGEPGDDRAGPWTKYARMTGGVVKLKRVD